MRLGQQVDIKGIVAGTPDADRAVRYLTKYLTKAVAETYADGDGTDAAYEDHIDRLHDEVRWLPCSRVRQLASLRRPARDAGPASSQVTVPKSHDREHLEWAAAESWSHAAGQERPSPSTSRPRRRRPRRAGGRLIDTPAADRMAAETLHDDGQPRFVGGRARLRT